MNKYGIAVAVVLTSALAFFIAGALRTRNRDQSGRDKAKEVGRTPIHAWEWEGGNVPNVPTPHPIVQSDQNGSQIITH